MSQQITVDAASIEKVTEPIPLEELQRDGVDEFGHLETDSHDHIRIVQPPPYTEPGDDGVQKTAGGVGGEVDTTLTDIDSAEKESALKRILNSKYVRRTIFSIRSHPALITLIYIIFTLTIEALIFTDLITGLLLWDESILPKSCKIFVKFQNVGILTYLLTNLLSLTNLLTKKLIYLLS